jgi:hypothetical protein
MMPIEVLTILPKPATMRMPGRDAQWQAPAGLSYQQVPLTAGPVVAELLRDGKVAVRLECPEPVSERPFRQETGKVGNPHGQVFTRCSLHITSRPQGRLHVR